LLLITIAITGAFIRRDVSSSASAIAKPLSPHSATTTRSGAASFAPIAPERP
jgi:hypothetical protein